MKFTPFHFYFKHLIKVFVWPGLKCQSYFQNQTSCDSCVEQRLPCLWYLILTPLFALYLSVGGSGCVSAGRGLVPAFFFSYDWLATCPGACPQWPLKIRQDAWRMYCASVIQKVCSLRVKQSNEWNFFVDIRLWWRRSFGVWNSFISFLKEFEENIISHPASSHPPVTAECRNSCYLGSSQLK